MRLPTSLLLAALVVGAGGCILVFDGDDAPTLPPDAGVLPDASPAPPDGAEARTCTCISVVDGENAFGVGLPDRTIYPDVVRNGYQSVRATGGRFVIIGTRTVAIVDPQTFAVLARVEPPGYATDAAIHAGRLYLVGTQEVAIFRLDDLVAPPTRVALPARGLASSVIGLGDHVYVSYATQLGGSPRLIVLSASSDAIVDTIYLRGEIVTGRLETDGQHLYVATISNGGVPAACLERITPGAPRAERCFAEVDVGLYSLEPGPGGLLYAAQSQSDAEGPVLTVDAEGTMGVVPYTAGHAFSDIAICGRYLVASDAGRSSTHVFDMITETRLTSAALPIDGRPASYDGLACLPRSL